MLVIKMSTDKTLGVNNNTFLTQDEYENLLSVNTCSVCNRKVTRLMIETKTNEINAGVCGYHGRGFDADYEYITETGMSEFNVTIKSLKEYIHKEQLTQQKYIEVGLKQICEMGFMEIDN